jgi:hypothetical protein
LGDVEDLVGGGNGCWQVVRIAGSGCGEQIDDILDGFVSAKPEEC